MGHVGLTTAPPQYGTSASKWYIKALEACAPIAKFSKVGVKTKKFSKACAPIAKFSKVGVKKKKFSKACAPIAKFSKVGVLTSSFSNVCVSNWHIKVLKRRKVCVLIY
jgi:hypothetical protein